MHYGCRVELRSLSLSLSPQFTISHYHDYNMNISFTNYQMSNEKWYLCGSAEYPKKGKTYDEGVKKWYITQCKINILYINHNCQTKVTIWVNWYEKVFHEQTKIWLGSKYKLQNFVTSDYSIPRKSYKERIWMCFVDCLFTKNPNVNRGEKVLFGVWPAKICSKSPKLPNAY